MNPRALEVLQLSIAHWERVVSGEDKYINSSYCALCLEFATPKQYIDDDICEGCPVYERTGRNSCIQTPYYEVTRALRVYGRNSIEFNTAAKEELKFLKSLLPITN